MHLFIYILTSWEQVLYWSLHSCRSDRSSQKLCLTDTRASPETHRKSRILNILLSFFILMNNPYPSWSNGSYKRVIIFSYTLLMLMLLLLYCLTYKMGIVMEFSIKECCLFLARYFLMTNNRTKKIYYNFNSTLRIQNVFKVCEKLYGNLRAQESFGALCISYICKMRGSPTYINILSLKVSRFYH